MTLPLGSALAPLALRGAAEQVAERLVTALALGEFVPGQRLPAERQLAAMLEVSRLSVRQALHLLAEEGYVEIVRGRNGGAVVRESWRAPSAAMIRRTLGANWPSLEWLFDLRRLIEPLIAERAAERRTGEDVEALREAFARYRAAGRDREASRAADESLHAAIGRATQNPYLADISRQIRAQVSLGFQAEPYSAAIRRRAIAQHAALVEAVAEGRAQDAAAIASEHFKLTEDALRRLLRRIGRET